MATGSENFTSGQRAKGRTSPKRSKDRKNSVKTGKTAAGKRKPQRETGPSSDVPF